MTIYICALLELIGINNNCYDHILNQDTYNSELFPYSESSEWEAKFYQIQSKYLLLLNELHNPQVCTVCSTIRLRLLYS